MKALLPHGVGQDHDRCDMIDHVFGVGERTAMIGCDAERAEHAGDTVCRGLLEWTPSRSKPNVFTPQATP